MEYVVKGKFFLRFELELRSELNILPQFISIKDWSQGLSPCFGHILRSKKSLGSEDTFLKLCDKQNQCVPEGLESVVRLYLRVTQVTLLFMS